MSGLLICPRHGGQGPHGTSTRLASKLAVGEPIPADWVSLVVVKSPGGSNWYLVDSEVAAAAGLDPAQGPFVLQNRNRELRRLNDRLLIVRLFPIGFNGPRVCKLCLAGAVEPQTADHLRLPPEDVAPTTP